MLCDITGGDERAQNLVLAAGDDDEGDFAEEGKISGNGHVRRASSSAPRGYYAIHRAACRTRRRAVALAFSSHGESKYALESQ